MERAEVKEGILYLLGEGRGKTLAEIQGFLELNGVSKYSGEDSESELKGLLLEMQEEGLLEQRFMVDGADTVDFAIEEDGMELLKTRGNMESKWNTGRPGQEPGQQMMKNMEDVE